MQITSDAGTISLAGAYMEGGGGGEERQRRREQVLAQLKKDLSRKVNNCVEATEREGGADLTSTPVKKRVGSPRQNFNRK